MIWAIGGGLAALTALAFLVPVFRRRRAMLGRDESALEIFKDQLSEVDRDAARGLISGDEAKAARSEIKRRMLTLTRSSGDAPASDGSGGTALMIVAALAIPAMGFWLYSIRGEPSIPSVPFAERAAEQEEATEVAQLAATLRNRLLEDRDGGPTDGWLLLGQTYMRMGRTDDAVEAFSRIAERPDATSMVFSQYAEALIAAENGVVTPRAAQAIQRAVQLDPRNPAGTYYQSQFLAQEGRLREAHGLLIARLRTADGFQPWMEFFVRQANQLAEEFGGTPVSLTDFAPMMQGGGSAIPGPTAEDMEAAQEMSDADRAEFVQSMVDRLATRLEQEPDDLEGWLRLARAYTVLGEAEGAARAASTARALADGLPEGDPGRAATTAALNALGL
ncbi:c-type cytochrome biogenesis protein CcmI [Tropicimonas sp. S265A]|uniref:c-type cytochrome biogenesis protein CcmI n=1 Tax=Tropicimonas sp. S265A TaxID=3415134 RepID=UPI003C7CC9C9